MGMLLVSMKLTSCTLTVDYPRTVVYSMHNCIQCTILANLTVSRMTSVLLLLILYLTSVKQYIIPSKCLINS